MTDMPAEMQMPQPTAEHEFLMRSIGEWDVAGKFFMEPGAPPMETTGTETVTALGGFWIESVYKSDFMGMPFEGHGAATYDPVKQCYVTTWKDSMAATFFHMTGQLEGDTMTCSCIAPDCMSGRETQHRTVETGCGTDRRVFSMYMTAEDGTEVQMMELTYTRRS